MRFLEHQMKPGVLKNALIDVVDDIESGSTLSEAFAKHPKCFDRLYVNMVKAGEAGGALEVILRRLAEFKEKAQSLKRKITGAMVYPAVVITVASICCMMIAEATIMATIFGWAALDIVGQAAGYEERLDRVDDSAPVFNMVAVALRGAAQAPDRAGAAFIQQNSRGFGNP